MLQDGFVLNFRSGAKGDFLMRYLNDLPPEFEQYGKTVHTEQFNSLRTLEVRVRTESIRNKTDFRKDMNLAFAGWIDTQPDPIIMLAHRLHVLCEENLTLLRQRCKHIYDLMVRPEDWAEVSAAAAIKNSPILLDDPQIEEMKGIDPRFNGKYRLDKHAFLFNEHYDFSDESRIDWIKTHASSEPDGYREQTELQMMRSTEKVSYDKLFRSPFEDLIRLYRELHGKVPDIDRYAALVKLTDIPKEMELFNHRIRIDYDSDSIITVLGKVNT